MPTKASVRTMTIHDGPSEEVLASLPPYGDDGHVSSRVVMALSDKEGERVVRCQLLLTRLVLEPEGYLSSRGASANGGSPVATMRVAGPGS